MSGQISGVDKVSLFDSEDSNYSIDSDVASLVSQAAPNGRSSSLSGHQSSAAESGGGVGSANEEDEFKQIRNYAKSETRNVQISRLLVVGSILAIGALVSALTYISLNNEIEKDSDDAFVLMVNTVEDSFRYQIYSIFQANRALSRAITTSAHLAKANFPLFSIPAFELLAYEARMLGGFEAVIFGPVAHRIDTWLEFSQDSRGWLDESRQIYDDLQPGLNRSSEPLVAPLPDSVWMYKEGSEGNRTGLVPLERNRIFVPSLHTSPPPRIRDESTVYQNVDLFSIPDYKAVSLAAVTLKDSLFSTFGDTFSLKTDKIVGEEYHETLHMPGTKNDNSLPEHPHSVAAQPVYKALSRIDVIGYVYTVIAWDHYLKRLLPEGARGIIAVLRNSCGQAYTYELDGNEAILVGRGDLHDPALENLARTIDFSENYFDPSLTSTVFGHCQVFLDVYQSTKFKESFDSSLPMIFATIVACLFAVMAGFFFLYARLVETRNNKVVGAAARSTAIVSSLFPSKVRDQLLAEKEKEHLMNKSDAPKGWMLSQRSNVSSAQAEETQSRPIADLFLETTVMFADIAGFTAWSSVREPAQVFILLEAIYQSFDEIAKRRRVFKVETIGDCYVAVCGLPTPCKNHFVVMARFARECMHAMSEVTNKLEIKLGPGTSDLSIRAGLHSGQVTGGVIRCERSRFQLFGDTMNTAARMESTGIRGRIQISEDTAALLEKAGKGIWVRPREEPINVKGKGSMQTYWLEPGSGSAASVSTSRASKVAPEEACYLNQSKASKLVHGKSARLIDWNVEVLQVLLKQILVCRTLPTSKHSGRKEALGWSEPQVLRKEGSTVLHEVREIISLPRFDETAPQQQLDTDDIELDPSVYAQLEEFVTSISAMYRENPFHNFEHASHVTMSVVKLLSRIVAPNTEDLTMASSSDHTIVTTSALILHDHTYGITSDPLTRFACVFSALIHDLDHPGVPNAQLVKEHSQLAAYYQNKSVAEQNSVDIAWNLLMDKNYKDLREAIYCNESELSRFRQLVVNSVMATDIVDKDLKSLRNQRWEKAFSTSYLDYRAQDTSDRRATIVIEHLIQASDVAHTMQHWHVYRKWNERLFHECYNAYLDGRADADPSVNWYSGELGFFDFYIIPLAKKLKECGVFGVSSDEYLNYAVKNRQEWKLRGEEIVHGMINMAQQQVLE